MIWIIYFIGFALVLGIGLAFVDYQVKKINDNEFEDDAKSWVWLVAFAWPGVLMVICIVAPIWLAVKIPYFITKKILERNL